MPVIGYKESKDDDDDDDDDDMCDNCSRETSLDISLSCNFLAHVTSVSYTKMIR
jgi:hypothetical protein